MLQSVGLLVWVLAAQFTVAVCLRSPTRTRFLLVLSILPTWSLGATAWFPTRFPDTVTVTLHAFAWIVTGAYLIASLLRLRESIDEDGRLARAAGRAAPWSGLAAALGLLLPAAVGGTSIGPLLPAAGLMIAASATACLAGLSGKPRSGWWPGLILFLAAMSAIILDLS